MKNYQKKEQIAREEQAREYDNWYIRSKWVLFDKIEKEIFYKNINTSGKILDLWCGTWRICEYVSKKTKDLYACDFSKKSLELLNNKKIISRKNIFFQDITQKIDFSDNFFNCIYSCQVIQHLQLDDLIKSLLEIKRILKKWGKFIFSVYNKNCYIYKNYEEILNNWLYLKRFDKKYIQYLAEKNWLKIKKIGYYWVNPILHKSSSKFNLYLEYFLQKIPFINKRFWKYLFVVLEK